MAAWLIRAYKTQKRLASSDQRISPRFRWSKMNGNKRNVRTRHHFAHLARRSSLDATNKKTTNLRTVFNAILSTRGLHQNLSSLISSWKYIINSHCHATHFHCKNIFKIIFYNISIFFSFSVTTIYMNIHWISNISKTRWYLNDLCNWLSIHLLSFH
jgi:hypothetical protein